MTMGDRIKTRQQLLDEQARAANDRIIPGDDPHDERARPHQVQDSTVQHVNQEGAEVQDGVDVARQELAKMLEG